MKKLITICSIFAFMVIPLAGQDLDEILENHFETIGQEKLNDIETMVIEGKMMQMNMEFPFKQVIKRPNMFKLEAEVQGQSFVQAYDGENGWMIAPWMGPNPVDLTGEQLEQALEQADIDGDLYNYKEKGHQLEYVGEEEMEGTPTYKLKLTKKNGDIVFYYLDKDSYVILKQESNKTIQGKEMLIEVFPSNYDMIDGIAVAKSIKTKMDGNVTGDLTIETVEFDKPIDETVFERPEIEEKTEGE
jgi:outer membrane lipoprotein-sorting protein